MVNEINNTLKIENIVASGTIAESIDLESISSKITGCELNTKKFPGAVYRPKKPKIASLIFSSGKVVLTGIRTMEELDEGIKVVEKSLKNADTKTLEEPSIAVTNIVCSYDMGSPINLNRVVVTLNMENIEYEPEQFPGLVYRIEDPKIVALLFSSGKIILTGGKELSEIRRGLLVLGKQLEGLM